MGSNPTPGMIENGLVLTERAKRASWAREARSQLSTPGMRGPCGSTRCQLDESPVRRDPDAALVVLEDVPDVPDLEVLGERQWLDPAPGHASQRCGAVVVRVLHEDAAPIARVEDLVQHPESGCRRGIGGLDMACHVNRDDGAAGCPCEFVESQRPEG